MEYADNGDLLKLINTRKQKGESFSEEEIINIFLQLSLALYHIHSHNVIHRDIKAGNVMLTSKNMVLV